MAPDHPPDPSPALLRWRAAVAVLLAGGVALVLVACGVRPTTSAGVDPGSTTQPGAPSVVMDGVIEDDGTTSTIASGPGDAEPSEEQEPTDPAVVCADLGTVGLVRSPLGEPRLPDPAGRAEAIERLRGAELPGSVDESIATVLDLAGSGEGPPDGDGDGDREPGDGLGEAPTELDSPGEVVTAGEAVIAWAAGTCDLPGPVWGCVVVLPSTEGAQLAPGQNPEGAWGGVHPGLGPPTRLSDDPVTLAHLDDAGLIRATMTIDPADTGTPVIWSARCWSPG